MSSSYSANQYDSAFQSKKLQNWSVAKQFKERPTAVDGYSNFIASDQGHLLPGLKRGRAWPDFKGTWEMPARLPLGPINPTARSMQGQRRLGAWAADPKHTTTSSSRPQENTLSARPEADGQAQQQTDGDPQLENPTLSSRPQSQACPTSAGKRPSSQGPGHGKLSQAVSRPDERPRSGAESVETKPAVCQADHKGAP